MDLGGGCGLMKRYIRPITNPLGNRQAWITVRPSTTKLVNQLGMQWAYRQVFALRQSSF